MTSAPRFVETEISALSVKMQLIQFDEKSLKL